MDNTIPEIIVMFTAYLKKELFLRDNTVIGYESDLLNFFNFLEDEKIIFTKIDKINQTNIMAYLLHLERENKTTATVARNVSTIKTFYNFLVNKGLATHNPSIKIKAPKLEVKAPISLSFEEMKMFLNIPNILTKKGIRDKAILELMYATGLKASEIINIEVSNVNIEYEYIQCFSNGRLRIVPMTSTAANALTNYINNVRNGLNVKNESTLLFFNMNGEQLSRQGLWKMIKAYSIDLGLEFEITPNVLRQSFATHLANNGADMQSLKEMMGHIKHSTTEVYYLEKQKSLKEVYAKAHPRVE